MNIIVFTGFFFPVQSPPSTCIKKYLDELCKNHQIVVVCPAQTRINQPMNFPYKIYQISNWVNNLRVCANDNKANNQFLTISKIIYFITRMLGIFGDMFTFPTRNSWLINEYINLFEKINKYNHIDVIISVSSPPCSHIAARNIKIKHPNIKWISYFTDPYTYYDPFYSWVLFKSKRRKDNFNTELSIYKKSDFSILTEELFPIAENKFCQSYPHIRPFSYTLSEFKGGVSHPLTNRVKLVYAGALRKNIRNPEFALSVLAKVTGIEVAIYQAGDCQDIINKYLTDFVEVHGLVDRNHYEKIICCESNVLINIGNSTSLQAPSKLLELVSTGKPVINFYVKKDSQFQLIEKYPIGLNVGLDDENASDMVYSFCQKHKDEIIQYGELKSIFPEYSFDNQISQLAGIIEG